jgi:hypothetical protein
VHSEDEPDEENRGQDEGAGDDESRPRVERMVSAHRDAEARRQGCEGEEQRERGPLHSRRRVAEGRCHGGRERPERDGGGVERRPSR